MSVKQAARDTGLLAVKVLVTRGNGFIGRALVPRLVQAGFDVRTTVREPAGLRNEVIVGDIGLYTDWSAAISDCRAVVHLASRVHIMRDESLDPLIEFQRVNTAGTLHLARQAAAAGVKRFVFASSIKVNGEGRVEAYKESDRPAPEDPYAVSKWEAEQGLRELSASTGMQIVVLRIPLVYGPEVKANFLRPLQAVDRGIPLPFSRIENRRSLIYLGNLVDAFATCLTHPAAVNETFLVSDDEDVSTPELIRRVASALHRPARLLAIPRPMLRLAGLLTGKRKEVARLLGSLAVDSRRIRSALGWLPPYSMQDGLKATVDWYREQQSARYD
jgi:nucleoside-diphosphate-sugar epimerase